MNQTQGVIFLVTFSLLTGMGGYFVKLTHGINPQQILFFRALLASIFLLSVAIFSHRLHELKFRNPVNTIVMGVVQGLSVYLFYAALSLTTITNAILLTYTAPIFSVILSVIFLRETIARKTIVGIIISLVGVILVSDPSGISIGSSQTLGSLLALLGAFFYAAMAISSKTLTQKTTPLYAAFWQYFIILILTSVFAFNLTLSNFTSNIVSLVYLGWAAGGIAFLLYMQGVKRVKGQLIQIITMLEVLVGSLSGVFLLGETLTLPIVLGAACILGGVLIATSKSQKKLTK